MPLFALPLPRNPSSKISSARPHPSTIIRGTPKKRKLPAPKRKKRQRPRSYHSSHRDSSSEAELSASESGSSEEDEEEDVEEERLPDASTNPLSLTPAEIAQYRLAGLELNEDLPGFGPNGVKDFPHRALPERDAGINSTVKEKDPTSKGADRGPHLRIQHLSVLTTILHRCLLEGDIPRATRAWSLLLRMEVNGKPIDYRRNGFWGIGAELLVRSLDEQPRREDDDDYDDTEDQHIGDDERSEGRWGTAEGWEKAKIYYERLILQHPYDRKYAYAGNATALQFWPAMISCGIYGIQWEEREALRQLKKEEESDEIEGMTENESEEMGYDGFDGAAGEGTAAQRKRGHLERIWEKREAIRLTALEASEKTATEMDQLLGTSGYMDSHVFRRLRGNLALYIGDLSVPAPPVDEEEPDAERRMVLRQRQAEHERGKAKRVEERARAKKEFDWVIAHGGQVRGVDMGALEYGDNDESEKLYPYAPSK